MGSWTAWMTEMASALGRASLEGGALVLGIWLLCRLVPRMPATLKTWLWWIVCLRLLIGLAVSPVRLAWLPAPAAPRASVAYAPPMAMAGHKQVGGATSAVQGGEGGTAGLQRSSANPSAVVVAPGPVPGVQATDASYASLRTHGAAALGALWLLALLAQLALAAGQIRKLRAALRSAEPVTDGEILAVWEDLCVVMKVSGARLLVSDQVASPQVVGLVRPSVLLPRERLARLAPSDLAMVLCHELAHLSRRDLELGWIPALAERLFFFHPLAVLAAREYALAREAACDAAVLAVLGEAPQAYGRLLLNLGISPRPARLQIAAAATAAPTRFHLKRRLEMLDHHASQKLRSYRSQVAWGALVALFALAAVVPFRIVAADPAPAAQASHALRAAAPPPPMPPTPPRPPRPPKPARVHHVSNGEEYVLLSSDGSSTMSGSMEDIARAKKLLGPGEKQILWFRQGGKEYVVRDPQLLKTAADLFAPQVELGKRQAALGAKQAELGSRQAALGAEQAKLGAQQAKLGAEQARVAADEARETSDGKEVNDRLAQQQDQLSSKQDALGRQQDELGRKQDELGKQQDALGKQQDELGRQQDKLGQEAEAKLKTLMNDAIAKGIAKPVGA